MSEPGSKTQEWRKAKTGQTVQLPVWVWCGSEVRAVHNFEDMTTNWTHWMPKIDDQEPAPPNERPPEWDIETTSRSGCVEAGERIREEIYSPARIQILLHCAVSPEPLPNFDAPVSKETIQEFLQLGVIEPYGPLPESPPVSYRATKLGRAWVQALCNVPIPRVVPGRGRKGDRFPMKIIRAILTFEIPAEKLKPGDRELMQKELESLQREISGTSANGIKATLSMVEIDTTIDTPPPVVCSCPSGLRDTKCPVHGDME